MKELENKLDELLVKKAPFQIPEKGRKWIADYAWVIALVGLVVGVFTFLPLLGAVGLVSVAGFAIGAGSYVLLSWLSLLAMLAYLVVLGISVPKLKEKQKAGWQLTYYSVLFFFVYDVIYLVGYMGSYALFSFMWNVLGLAVALYILFQVKSHFKN